MSLIEFTIPGTAAPKGSKTGYGFNRKDGTRGVNMTEACNRTEPWLAVVALAGARVHKGRPLLNVPLCMTMAFYRKRPKYHYGTGRNAGKVKPSAPALPAVPYDVLKLGRAVEDALKGVIYRDDALICDEHLYKRWGEPERVEIRIQAIEDPAP